MFTNLKRAKEILTNTPPSSAEPTEDQPATESSTSSVPAESYILTVQTIVELRSGSKLIAKSLETKDFDLYTEWYNVHFDVTVEPLYYD